MKITTPEKKEYILSYGNCILVWVVLLILTGITVTVAGMNLGALSIITALFVASAKSLLVLLVYMNLRHEEGVFKIMLLLAVTTLAVIIGLTFFDIWFR